MTTEFWLSIIMAVTVIVAGYVSDAFDVDLAWALGTGIIAAYALSRGFAKAGSREGPFMIDLTRTTGSRTRLGTERSRSRAQPRLGPVVRVGACALPRARASP